jgi:hypothetical protein
MCLKLKNLKDTIKRVLFDKLFLNYRKTPYLVHGTTLVLKKNF